MRPPNRDRASRSATSSPRATSTVAAARPAAPPPRTRTSWRVLVMASSPEASGVPAVNEPTRSGDGGPAPGESLLGRARFVDVRDRIPREGLDAARVTDAHLRDDVRRERGKVGLARDQDLTGVAIEGHARFHEEYGAGLFDREDDADVRRGPEVEAGELVDQEVGGGLEDREPALLRADRVLTDPMTARPQRLERGVVEEGGDERAHGHGQRGDPRRGGGAGGATHQVLVEAIDVGRREVVRPVRDELFGGEGAAGRGHRATALQSSMQRRSWTTAR